jgi:membrane protease YdiL (CAAX protease family)
MDQLVACPDCGTPNRADADLCVQCWRALSDDVLSKIPAAAFAVASAAPVAPPPPTAPRYLRPAPVKPSPEPEPVVREATPGPVPYFAPARGGEPPKTGVEAGFEPPLGRKNYSWKFRHLLLIGMSAWGIPYCASWTLVKGKTGAELVNGILAVQVGGYLIAALALACLVAIVQRGDWSSVGLNRTERSPLDFALGAALGFALITAFIGGVYVIEGSFELDFLTRYMLGGTTGPGAMLGAVVLVLGAPVIEEVYFRGLLFDRFARWGVLAAVVGTSVLFVLVHGVGLWDPPRLLMGFALGIARRTKSLWFTIAAHAAWNGAIVFLALFMMTGSAHNFTSEDGSFSLDHPAKWERLEMVEDMPEAGMELLLTSPGGSFLAVASLPVPPNLNRYTLTQVVQQIQGALPLPPNVTMGGFQETHNVPGPTVTSYESMTDVTDPMGGRGKVRMVLALRDGSSSLVMMFMGCPAEDCGEAEKEFDSMLKSVDFGV